MLTEQDTPEIVFSDIVTDMFLNKKYLSYTEPEEWALFFSSMTTLAKQVVQRVDNLQVKINEAKEQSAEAAVENQETRARLAKEKEQSRMIQ